MSDLAVRPSIPQSRFVERLTAARRQTRAHGLQALLVGVGSDLRYLTGYEAPALERLTMLVVPGADDRPLSLVVPRLEADPARRAPASLAGAVEVTTWEETEDPHAVVAGLAQPGTGSSAGGDFSMAVTDTVWASHLLRLQAAMSGVRFVAGSTVMRELRMVKDADEIELLRMAAHAADRVVDQIAAGRLIGRTEAEVSAEVRDRLVAEGHESGEFAIVASGPNASSPHHHATERRIVAGEPIVLDIGGPLEGYMSDTTRTLWPTGGDASRAPDPAYMRAFDVLRRAQAAATAAVRPGVAAEAIDAAARGIIDAAGFGSNFIHRTGHGIGLEGHEDPYLVAGNRESLEQGHAFSVEPGIYLEGSWGMRLEDIVVCGPDGPDVLNLSSLDLRVVDGI